MERRAESVAVQQTEKLSTELKRERVERSGYGRTVVLAMELYTEHERA